MADAQKAESTPSPDTEGVRLAEKLDAIARDMDRAVGGGMMWINLDEEREFAGRIRRVAAALRTAQNTGTDEVLEEAGKAVAWELTRLRAIVRGESPSLLDDYDGGSVPEIDGEAALSAWRAALKSSPPVSTVDEEGGGQ